MALVSVALVKSTFKESHPHIKGFILPYSPAEEKTTRKIVKRFLKKHAKKDRLLVFADKRSDKLGNLVILKDECDKAGVKLDISLYCEDKDHYSERFEEWYFREVDLNLSEELKNMAIW